MIEFEGQKMSVAVAEKYRLGLLPPLRNWQEKPTRSQSISRMLRTFFRIQSEKDTWVRGIDISKWQGVWNVQKTIAAGAKFAIVKATQNRFTDPKFDANVALAAAADFPIGVYHFADPGGYSAILQAQYFANVINGIPQLSVAMDLEWNGGLSPTVLSSWVQDFMGELSVQIPDKHLACYSTASWWNSHVAASPWVSQYDFWVARWAEWLDGPWSDGKYIPRDWSDWRLWQYSGNGNGLGSLYGVESNSIDLNYFHGDWAAFQNYYFPEPPDPGLEERVEELEIQMVYVLDWIENHDNGGDIDPPPAPDPETITLRAKEKFPLGIAVDHDKKCEGEEPSGKPVIEHPPQEDRIIYQPGDTFDAYAAYQYSCVDDPDTPIIYAAGREPFYVAVDGYPGQISFAKASLVEEV